MHLIFLFFMSAQQNPRSANPLAPLSKEADEMALDAGPTNPELTDGWMMEQ
jgi:hypothetical protein